MVAVVEHKLIFDYFLFFAMAFLAPRIMSISSLILDVWSGKMALFFFELGQNGGSLKSG